MVSPTDPEAALARDNEEVYRPLYSVQVLRDLDSPLILAHAVVTRNNDNGVLGPLIERMADAGRVDNGTACERGSKRSGIFNYPL